MGIDKKLLDAINFKLYKKGYVPPPMAGGMPPGMDPSMMGGMSPQGGMPMDPSMMGGQPPMDPATGGMDLSMMGGMPMDPAMMPPGEMPPPDEDPFIKRIENMDSRLKNLEDRTKIIIDKLDLILSEIDIPKMASEKSDKNYIHILKQLLTDGDK